jgi:hypothetical protein
VASLIHRRPHYSNRSSHLFTTTSYSHTHSRPLSWQDWCACARRPHSDTYVEPHMHHYNHHHPLQPLGSPITNPNQTHHTHPITTSTALLDHPPVPVAKAMTIPKATERTMRSRTRGLRLSAGHSLVTRGARPLRVTLKWRFTVA